MKRFSQQLAGLVILLAGLFQPAEATPVIPPGNLVLDPTFSCAKPAKCGNFTFTDWLGQTCHGRVDNARIVVGASPCNPGPIFEACHCTSVPISRAGGNFVQRIDWSPGCAYQVHFHANEDACIRATGSDAAQVCDFIGFCCGKGCDGVLFRESESGPGPVRTTFVLNNRNPAFGTVSDLSGCFNCYSFTFVPAKTQSFLFAEFNAIEIGHAGGTGHASIDPVITIVDESSAAPEIDPSSAIAPLGLALGVLALALDRRPRRTSLRRPHDSAGSAR